MPDDDIKRLLRRVRAVELKLDVLIESQGLTDAVAEREAAQKEEFARRGAGRGGQFPKAGRG